MRFVIDETSWRFDGLTLGACVEALETMLDQIEDAQAQGHLACYSEELFYTLVWENKSFYELYALDAPIPIPREVQERFDSNFHGLSKWQDMSPDWRPSKIKFDGSPEEEAPSIAWAHEQTVLNRERAIACLVFPGGRPAGFFDVTVNQKKAPLWLVADSKNYCDFFRWLIVETTKNPDEMERFASSAFSSLDFMPGTFNGIKKMSKNYQELVKPLVHHLGALSDHGKRVFEKPWSQVAAEFGGVGVNISDENGKTKSNTDARKERTVEFNGNDIICWWHIKLEPHQDRIYLSPDRIHSGGKLLVGIFCEHLKT
jgi:hypothetical protein